MPPSVMPSLTVAAPDPRQRQLAGMRQMVVLEHLDQRWRRSDRRPARRGGRRRAPAPPRASASSSRRTPMSLLGHAHEHRHHLVGAQRLAQVAQDSPRPAAPGPRAAAPSGRRRSRPASRASRGAPSARARDTPRAAGSGRTARRGVVACRPPRSPDRHSRPAPRRGRSRTGAGPPAGRDRSRRRLQQIAVADLRAVHLVDEDQVRDLRARRGTGAAATTVIMRSSTGSTTTTAASHAEQRRCAPPGRTRPSPGSRGR